MIRAHILLILCLFNLSVFGQKIASKQTAWKAKKTTLNCEEGRKYLPFDATFLLIDSSSFKLIIYSSGQKSEILVELGDMIRANLLGELPSKTFECVMKMREDDEENTALHNGEATLCFYNNEKNFTLEIQMPNQEECVTIFQFVPKIAKKVKK